MSDAPLLTEAELEEMERRIVFSPEPGDLAMRLLADLRLYRDDRNRYREWCRRLVDLSDHVLSRDDLNFVHEVRAALDPPA